jgi:thiamine-phosphate pyrophosphorylase
MRISEKDRRASKFPVETAAPAENERRQTKRLRQGDLLLYLCADRSLAMGRPLTAAVEAAIAGGVTMVQIRENDASGRDFYEAALALRTLTRARGIPFVVNDRADIALAVDADGLHIGQSDMPLRAARRIVGDRMFIGVSARTAEAARAAQADGADYLGTGPVFPTGSKTDVKTPIGPAGLRAVRAAVHIPVIGIGGIGLGNAAEVMETGAAGIAVISAILSQPDIETAARLLRGALR